MENKICKVVYFDEDSVTDYVQIVAGGSLENTEELLKGREVTEEQEVQANAKGGIGGVFKALLGWEANASAEISAGLAFNSNKLHAFLENASRWMKTRHKYGRMKAHGMRPAFYAATSARNKLVFALPLNHKLSMP